MSVQWLDKYRREAFIDFHNGAVAADLMVHFDPERYADTLVKAHVNRVTVFAKDHHGHAYYPTRVGDPHPHLKGVDFFGRLSRACHERGLDVLAYQNVGRDVAAAVRFPDWQQTRRDGTPIEQGYHRHLCFNSPYIPERLWPMTDELLRDYPWVRSFFFDFSHFVPGGCFCRYCMAAMQRQGVNPDDDKQVMLFQWASIRNFMATNTARVLACNPDAAIYYNHHARVGTADDLAGQVYWYVEALPSTWAYELFPFRGRYLRGKGKPLYYGTGRFHMMWGDFGGIKPDASFRYEAGLALAMNAGFSIGDQGNPDGTLDPAVYESVGKALGYYEEREAYSVGSQSLPYVAILSWPFASSHSNHGLTNALTEEKFHFDVIDFGADFSRYKAIVLEDVTLPDPLLAEKLRAYVAGGGRLLVLGEALFKGAGRPVLEEILGVQFAGSSPYSCHYIRTPDGELGARLPKTDWVTYGPACYLRPVGAQPLVQLVYPFTERTDQRAVSHAQAHPGQPSPFPATTIHQYGRGQAVVVASALATLYQSTYYPPLRILLRNLLDCLVPPAERVVTFRAPLSAEIVLNRQGDRYVIHLLNCHTNRMHNAEPWERGQAPAQPVVVVEEIPPVLDAEVRLLLAGDPARVYLAPEGKPLDWSRDDGHIVIRIPRYDTHAIVVVEP